MTVETIDLAVVGAGPAGLAAACEARQHGLSVALLDEQHVPGGQIYRAVDAASPAKQTVLGEDYAAGRSLTQAFEASGAQHIAGAAVWNVDRDRTIHYLRDGMTHSLQARRIILASGAMERPFPIAGWTLPGVMGAGAAQVLLKTANAIPATPPVLAGCGPLLYLLAAQYIRAGVPIAAVIDTTHHTDYLRASRQLIGALRGWRDLRKGLRMMAALRRSNVMVHTSARDLRVEGHERAQALTFTRAGRTHRIDTPLVLLHQGVVPNTQLTWALRAEHAWDEAQACWTPVTDAWGQIATTGIYVAGDSRGIVGAQASAEQGRLAAISICVELERVTRQAVTSRVRVVRAALAKHLQIRPFLDALYRPPEVQRMPTDDAVIVCRCEEVTAGQIRRYVALGCQGPNQTKAFGRCGMGPCQGRLCGLTVTELIAQARHTTPGEVGYYRVRPPIKPITLGELAG